MVPRLEVPELRAQDRRLESVHPRVSAFDACLERRSASSLAQHLDALDERGVDGDNGPRVAERPEVLGRIEAERGGVAVGAGARAVTARAVGLGRAFDDDETVAVGDLADGRHLREAAV